MEAVGGGNMNSAMEKRLTAPLYMIPISVLTFTQFATYVHITSSNHVQVDQYHEEAGGQRTVVRLGEFSKINAVSMLQSSSSKQRNIC